MCQLMASSLYCRDSGWLSGACAQRQESKLAKESNSASLSSQNDKGFSFLEVLSGQQKPESQLQETAEAGRLSWPMTELPHPCWVWS